MTTQIATLPAALERHLSAAATQGLAGVGSFIETGARLVSAETVALLREQRIALQLRIAALGESERLRGRLELLAAVFDEAATGAAVDPHALQEITFALLYFLKSVDRIPDDVPQIGLLDDAVVIQFVLQRQAAAIRGRALRRGWELPAEVL